MRFVVSEKLWALDALNPVEWHFLCELPDAAIGKGMDTLDVNEVLFPSPVDANSDDDSDSGQQIKDWEEFVQPEIETLFNEARKVVDRDINAVETLPASEFFNSEDMEEMGTQDEALPEYRRLLIPRDHTEAWYSTLNQARLLMNEQHKIADSTERFSILMGIEDEEELTPERGMLLAQYEMYSAIQSILVENLMS